MPAGELPSTSEIHTLKQIGITGNIIMTIPLIIVTIKVTTKMVIVSIKHHSISIIMVNTVYAITLQ